MTCSGFESAGSLRIVRNGIGVIEQATVELEGEQCMSSPYHTTHHAYVTLFGDQSSSRVHAQAQSH